MTDTLEFIVNKYGIDLKQKSPITIPNFSRYDLANLFAELGFQRGAEIGVQNGKFSKVLCEANPTMEFYGIDPWVEGVDPWLKYPEIPKPDAQEGQEQGYANAKRNVPANCTLIRKKSMEALLDFEDDYFDFVYVDGNHEFVSAASDIHYWLRKIRSGGIMAGHDYRPYYPRSFIHVFQVVNGYTDGYGIHPWFLTDYSVETVRSFFWVKA